MGLDNFVSRSPGEAVLTPEDERAIVDAGARLCRGIHSDGVTSFRGKVYARFVSAVTGESLYEEWLAPRTVADMADKLAVYDPESTEQSPDLDPDSLPSPSEIRNLQKLFRVCADRGLGIIGWS